MSRRSAWLVASAGLLAVTACSDSSTPTTAPSLSSPSFAVSENDHRHLMPTQASAWAARAARPTRGTGITYHGGPVLQAGTKVATIYWASATIYPGGPTPGTYGAASGDGSLIGFFLSHIGGTPYFNINHSYTNGSGAAIVNSVTYTQYWANNTNAPSGTTSISDAQMIAMLQSGFDSGKLTYDPSTLYHIFTSGTVNLGGGFTATPQYCAYHTHGTVTIGGVAKTVLYSAMPYNMGRANYCSNGTASPNNDPGADAEVNTLVHETEETTTDMMGTAWYDSRGYENADKCAWTWGTTYTTANGGTANVNVGGKDFLIQRNWLNAGSGGCFMSY
jgi:hypothetical protein